MNPGSLIKIRDAEPGEHDAIQRVTLAAYQQYAAEMPHWEMYHQHLLTSLANDQASARIVAELDGEIVGSVLLSPPPAGVDSTVMDHSSRPEVRLLAVAPTARGLGVGAALLDACIQRALHGGATKLSLHTEDRMEVAMSMYLRKGFVRAPETDFSPAPSVLVKGFVRDLDDMRAEAKLK